MKKIFRYVLLSFVLLILVACGKKASEKAFDEKFKAKKYERIDKETEIRLNSLNSIENYDIILVNKDSKIKDNIKKKYEVKDFFEDSLVIIGRRRIDNLSIILLLN